MGYLLAQSLFGQSSLTLYASCHLADIAVSIVNVQVS